MGEPARGSGLALQILDALFANNHQSIPKSPRSKLSDDGSHLRFYVGRVLIEELNQDHTRMPAAHRISQQPSEVLVVSDHDTAFSGCPSQNARIGPAELLGFVAALVGVSPDTVINWELREIKPISKSLRKVLEVLGIEIS